MSEAHVFTPGQVWMARGATLAYWRVESTTERMVKVIGCDRFGRAGGGRVWPMRKSTFAGMVEYLERAA